MSEPRQGEGTLYLRRLTDVVHARLADEPVVALQGPRTVGKSTLLAEVARAYHARLLDLDDLATRDAVAADPGLFVAGGDLVCVDEYQHVPVLLDAIKAELNRDLRPGRFLLTGSTRSDALPVAARALTGRMHSLTVHPLSQGEIRGVHENFVATLFDDPSRIVAHGNLVAPSRAQVIEAIVAGGFPLAVSRSATARGRWFDDYLTQSLERDVRELARVRQREQLPQLLRALAGQTGQLLNVANAARKVRMDERTAESYTRLLEAVFLVYRLPAWGRTLRSRVSARPKLHILDAGVAARLLRLTGSKLEQLDPAALTQFGHLLETFVVAEVLKQVSWLDGIAGVGHWRTHDGHEVDIVVERDDGAIIAIEVKASGRAGGDGLRGLRQLRAACGDAFVAGVALHLGPSAYAVEDRVLAAPVDRLWTEIQ